MFIIFPSPSTIGRPPRVIGSNFSATFAIPLLLILTLPGIGRSDCRGCCSGHKGVVCSNGVTKCNDGSVLSEKCLRKRCSLCSGWGPDVHPKSSAMKVAFSSASLQYNRTEWPHWVDEDRDCQNTRSEILQHDNVGILKYKRNKPCNVSWGKWFCPYTGKILLKASDVDIDHIVPLSHAHTHGGAAWSREKKREFANDPLNLISVEDHINQAKGDKGPDEWKPPRREFWEEYARRWRAVKVKYGLVIDPTEDAALREMAIPMRTLKSNLTET